MIDIKREMLANYRDVIKKDFPDREIIVSDLHNYFYIVDKKERKVYKYSMKNNTQKEVAVNHWKFWADKTRMVSKLKMFNQDTYFDMNTWEIIKTQFWKLSFEDKDK